jgi:hypothetical protein
MSMRQKCASAIYDELTMQREAKIFKPVHKVNVSNTNASQTYPSHMFSKEKFLANGDLKRVNARAVAGGDHVELRAVGETSPPAMNTLSLTMILSVAAFMRFEVSTHDVMGAFLAADPTVDERPIYLKLEEVMAGFIPDAEPLIETGTDRVYFCVMLYPYAPPQASPYSLRHMGSMFKMLGFERLLYDKVVYLQGQYVKVRVIVAIHADDMPVVGLLFLRVKSQKEIKNKCVPTNHSEPNLSHIGFAINFRPTSISMFQKECPSYKLGKFEHVMESCKRPAHTPGLPSLTLSPPITTDPRDPEPEDGKPDAKKRTTDAADVASDGTNVMAFLSIVMSLTWLSWRTEEDILPLTTCPATGTHTATVACFRVVAHILNCLQNMSSQATTFKGGDEIKCVFARVYRDACHPTHVDDERHGGIEIVMCSQDINARNMNVKTTIPSSTNDQIYYDQGIVCARLCRARRRQMAPRDSRTSCQSVLQRSSDARRPQEENICLFY